MTQFPGIVLSGVGLVSRAGTSKDDFFAYLNDGIAPDEKTTAPDEPAPGQLLNFLGVQEPKLKMARYLDPVSKNAVVALKGAMSDAGIDEAQIAAAPHDYGVILGATRGPCLTREGLYESLAARHGNTVSATLFSHCGYNIAGAMMAIAFGIRGPNITVAAGGDLGVAVLRRARQFLTTGRAHTMFAGFSECAGKYRGTAGPAREFAYLLCLERKDRAIERGACVRAELRVTDPADEPSWVEAGESGGVAALRSSADSSRVPTGRSDPRRTGLDAFGERYRSLLTIGLLSHRGERKEHRQAFMAGAGRNPARVELFCSQEEHATV